MTWTVLKIPCPGKKCLESGPRQWSHYQCGGILFINESANIGCNKCNKVSNVFQWGFDCGNHPASDRFQTPSLDTFSSIIARATELTSTMGVLWFRTLMVSMLG